MVSLRSIEPAECARRYHQIFGVNQSKLGLQANSKLIAFRGKMAIIAPFLPSDMSNCIEWPQPNEVDSHQCTI